MEAMIESITPVLYPDDRIKVTPYQSPLRKQREFPSGKDNEQAESWGRMFLGLVEREKWLNKRLEDKKCLH